MMVSSSTPESNQIQVQTLKSAKKSSLHSPGYIFLLHVTTSSFQTTQYIYSLYNSWVSVFGLSPCWLNPVVHTELTDISNKCHMKRVLPFVLIALSRRSASPAGLKWRYGRTVPWQPYSVKTTHMICMLNVENTIYKGQSSDGKVIQLHEQLMSIYTNMDHSVRSQYTCNDLFKPNR